MFSKPSDAEQRTWRCLADPHRRRVLDLLREGPLTTGGIAAHFGLSRFGVMKHLRVLVDAGLVLVEPRGRERWNHLNTLPIQQIHRRWIRPFEATAGDRLLKIRGLVAVPEDFPMTQQEHAFQVHEIAQEITIAAPRARVWEAITSETSRWWPRDFYTGEEPRGFHIEARPGGRMWEDWGQGQGRLWGTVTTVREGELLELSGFIAPEWGGPAQDFTTWRLEERGGETVLRFRETVFGATSEGHRRSLEDGWRDLLGRYLKDFVERGTRSVPESSDDA